MINTLPSWSYPLILLVLLICAGVGEYLRMVPPGTFSFLLTVSIGLVAPSPIFPHTTQVSTPQATINTQETKVTP